MKTSNKLLVLAVVVLLASITSYNFSLKAEYNKRAFISEFYEYNKLNFKDFNEIEVKGANILDLKILQSDTFVVRMRKRFAPRFTIEQSGRKLVISLVNNEDSYSSEKEIVIFCPKLNRLVLDGVNTNYYNSKDSMITAFSEQDWRRTVVEGFEIDSLNIALGVNNTLKLNNNKIKQLYVNVGEKQKSGSKLIIWKDNVIEDAFFDIADKNELQLISPQIENLKYIYADGATISLTGKAHSLLK